MRGAYGAKPFARSFAPRAVLVGIGLVLSLGAGCRSEMTASEGSTRPNVLLITIDTLRPDFLGAHGSVIGASPSLDALARESVVFERAIAAAPRTVPSHASIMTSLWVRDHSVGWMNGSTRLDGEWTLAERFAGEGYDTAAFVGNMMLSTRVGLDSGFDIYDDDLQQAELNRPEIRERTAARTTRRALAWLASNHDAPWFLWVHYQDPHGPYTPPDEYADLFDLREDDEEPLPRLEKNRGERGIPAYQWLPGLDLAGQYASRYAGEIRYFDRWLGTLLETVDQGSAKPIVLVTADHGESLGEEGWWFSHGFRTTPDQIHVPFILRAASLEPGRRDELVHHVDVAPTLLDLAGLEVPSDARGLALGRLLEGESARFDRIVFADVGFETTAYKGSHFMRRITEGESTGSRSFRWSSTRHWASADSVDAIGGAVDRYLETETNLVRAETLDPARQAQRLEQLRALGYVESGEEEERPAEPLERSR